MYQNIIAMREKSDQARLSSALQGSIDVVVSLSDEKLRPRNQGLDIESRLRRTIESMGGQVWWNWRLVTDRDSSTEFFGRRIVLTSLGELNFYSFVKVFSDSDAFR